MKRVVAIFMVLMILCSCSAAGAENSSNEMEGTWKVGAVISNGMVIDINDVDELASMYEYYYLHLKNDSSFSYITYGNLYKGKYEKSTEMDDSYILDCQTEMVLQDGEMTDIPLTSEYKHMATLLDENTLILSDYPEVLETGLFNDLTFVYVLDGAKSQYVLDNKKQFNTSTSNDSGSQSNQSVGSSSKPSGSSSTVSVTTGMRNALGSAKDYLRVMAFSRSGLIEQLEYEGYTNSEATYAVDNCGADWQEQAVKCARSYLNTMSFSRSGLIEQLEYEGFTSSQAQYAVDKVY